jgi:PBSX family phage terminase large subunit
MFKNPFISSIAQQVINNQLTFNPKKVYKMPSAFREILGKYKYSVINGGRASTKTQSPATFLIEESFLYKDSVILCGRQYMATIKDSVYSVIKQLIDKPQKHKLSDFFKINDREIINLLTNTRFVFRGFNDFSQASSNKSSNLNKIKSLSSIIYVWIDEAQDITNRTLDILVPTGREFIVSFYDKEDFIEENINLDKSTKFIFTMNMQTSDDAVLHYFNNYDGYYFKTINIFDLEEEFQNKDMLVLAEQHKLNKPQSYNHVWLGTEYVGDENSLFPMEYFVEKDIDVKTMDYICIAIDPAMTSRPTSDETGIIIAGYKEGRLYVLEDLSGRYTGLEWANIVINAYDKYKANAIIVEVNNGGDLVAKNLTSVKKSLPIHEVRAKGGKYLRAEPVAKLYEDKLVYHKKEANLKELKKQLNQFNIKMGLNKLDFADDRADACVYALTFLQEQFLQTELKVEIW